MEMEREMTKRLALIEETNIMTLKQETKFKIAKEKEETKRNRDIEIMKNMSDEQKIELYSSKPLIKKKFKIEMEKLKNERFIEEEKLKVSYIFNNH